MPNSVDEAIRRRFNLVPFTVSIPAHERDLTLPDRLRPEWHGILAWAIEGCLEWQEHGLAPPGVVTRATAAYLDSEDALAAWITECCDQNPNAWERSADLFGSWTAWAERFGEARGDSKRFREKLETRGIAHRLEPGTKRAGYQGLSLKRQDFELALGIDGRAKSVMDVHARA